MKKFQFSVFAMMIMALVCLGFTSCSSDDDESSDIIPSGTYIEENGDEAELFSLLVNGNNVRWTCTVYGKVESVIDYTYTIKGNIITMVSSKYGTETTSYKRNGNRIIIGEITYIKQ
ncbi:MAG: hypothetical protein IJV44_04940 [Prevotella sp.]|nr:hypothetical protein [Prevotella sp.]